ncbi:MAG: hypothetical protein ACO3O3_10860 [Ilumatobacteraceae bacterium]
MTISERVQEVFQRFNVNLTVTEEPRTELAEAVLENGTVIYTDADDFSEGAEAYIINDEGERIPLPQGDYTLQDGSVLKIADGGKVAGLTSKGEGKEGKGDGKADGNAPKVKEPVAEAPAKEAPAKEAPANDAPAKAPVKKVTKSSDEEMEEVTINYVTREEVEALIAEAIAALAPAEEPAEEVVEEEVEAKDKDKEEMSSQEPEVVVEEVATEEVEEPQDDPVAVELASVKAELEAMKKQAAEGGLKHAAPTANVEPVNLKNLSTSERVSALLNQFS